MQIVPDSVDVISFDRSTRRTINNLNLTPLIDVLFILIIFFMLTTSFMRVESLELILPSTTATPTPKTNNEVVRVFIHADGDITLGKRKVNIETLNASLGRMFEKDDQTKVMLLTAEGVNMQQLVNVMDRIYMAGGKSLYVRKWQSGPGKDKMP